MGMKPFVLEGKEKKEKKCEYERSVAFLKEERGERKSVSFTRNEGGYGMVWIQSSRLRRQKSFSVGNERDQNNQVYKEDHKIEIHGVKAYPPHRSSVYGVSPRNKIKTYSLPLPILRKVFQLPYILH